MRCVAEDLTYRAPGVDLNGKDAYQGFIGGGRPRSPASPWRGTAHEHLQTLLLNAEVGSLCGRGILPVTFWALVFPPLPLDACAVVYQF